MCVRVRLRLFSLDNARIAINQTIVWNILSYHTVRRYRHIITDVYLASHHSACIYSHIIPNNRLTAFPKSHCHILIETKILAYTLSHNKRSETVLHFQSSANICGMNPTSALSWQQYVQQMSPKERNPIIEHITVILCFYGSDEIPHTYPPPNE